MADVMCWTGGRIHWNFQFRRPSQDWEEVSFDRFMAIVYSRNVRGIGLGKVCWKLARSRGFEVRGFFLSTLLFSYPSLGE